MRSPYAYLCTNYIHAHRIQLYVFIQVTFLPFFLHKIPVCKLYTGKQPVKLQATLITRMHTSLQSEDHRWLS